MRETVNITTTDYNIIMGFINDLKESVSGFENYLAYKGGIHVNGWRGVENGLSYLINDLFSFKGKMESCIEKYKTWQKELEALDEK
jgi:hypothetical protein